MGIYISSDGTEKDTATMNSFNLVNGLIKNVQESLASNGMDAVSAKNIEALKAELLTRLDTRTEEEKTK